MNHLILSNLSLTGNGRVTTEYRFHRIRVFQKASKIAILCHNAISVSVRGVSSPVVSVLDSRSNGPGSSPGWGMTMCP